jgi:hypothetical protein
VYQRDLLGMIKAGYLCDLRVICVQVEVIATVGAGTRRDAVTQVGRS